MSLVSIVAREGFVTVMSDGRMTQNKELVTEEYQKFKLLSPNFFLAYTGHAGPAEALLQTFERDGMNEKLTALPFEHIYFLIHSLVENCLRGHPQQSLLTFGGRNEKGEIEIYYINPTDMTEARFMPKGNDIDVIIMGPNPASGYTKILEKHLSVTGHQTPEQILAAQKLLNDIIAQTEPSVNTNTFELIIRQ